MPQIGKRTILANLKSSLAALPQQDPEQVFAEALRDARLKDKPFYSAEEAALIARALMARAAADSQAALEALAAASQAAGAETAGEEAAKAPSPQA